MARRLRFGILGLGRRWPRYRRALLALADEVRVVTVHDAAAVRSQQEARDLGAEAVGGVVELLERNDVDAVLLAGRAWYGLWPLERAAAAGKPTLCAVSPIEDEANFDQLRSKIPDTARIDFALWPALTVARETLADQVQEALGQPRFAQATWARRRDAGPAGDVLASPAALALLRECAALFGSAPEAVTAQGADDLTSVILRFAEGRTAQLTLWCGPSARTSCCVQVEAENGSARIDLPRAVEWRDEDGQYRHELPAGTAEAVTLARFAQAVREGGAPACSLGEACQALDWLRAARNIRDS